MSFTPRILVFTIYALSMLERLHVKMCCVHCALYFILTCSTNVYNIDIYTFRFSFFFSHFLLIWLLYIVKSLPLLTLSMSLDIFLSGIEITRSILLWRFIYFVSTHSSLRLNAIFFYLCLSNRHQLLLHCCIFPPRCIV